MEFGQMSGGYLLERTDSNGAPMPLWLSILSDPLGAIGMEANSAGDGGNGAFDGGIFQGGYSSFEPFNLAQSDSSARVAADQTNIGYFGQSAIEFGGVGGEGGDGNAARGGAVGVHGSLGADVIATGENSAGNGGDGFFSGTLVHAPVALYDPINIAVSGSHATAVAHQSNAVEFQQSATQVAGIGGHGGNGNHAKGGDVSGFGLGPSLNHLMGFDVIASGGSEAGNGGSGSFSGSLVHASFALYEPINIAAAGYNSTAHADQTNNVDFNQTAFQMAGVGGHGGNGNVAMGGQLDAFASGNGLIGSDVIATGANSAGGGGNGHFFGSVVDVSVAIYAPINIAVAGYNSTADAHQLNNVHFDQSATQIAGIGGDGGHGNVAQAGDLALHFLADHFLDHLGA
jgi:hypothetical protein